MGFLILFCVSAQAQPGSRQTFTLTAPLTVTKLNNTPPFIDYSFSLVGRIEISGLPGLNTFQATGRLATDTRATTQTPATAYGLISAGNVDQVIAFKIFIPAAFVTRSPGTSVRDSVHASFMSGSNGTFYAPFATVSENAAGVATLEASGEALIYSPYPNNSATAPPAFLGSFPHIAVGGGWKTTFFFTRAASVFDATAELRFYGDDGSPLVLPVTSPQGGTRSSVWSGLVSGPGVVVLEASTSDSTDPLKVGSAHLWTTGPVDGYAVYRHIPSGQEAVVPLQRASPGNYTIPFDNTDGTSTGVALTNISGGAPYVSVSIETDAGSSTLPQFEMPKNGHLSFVVAERYPQTAGRRGAITFSSSYWPLGSIAATGIRATSTGAFTSLPVPYR